MDGCGGYLCSFWESYLRWIAVSTIVYERWIHEFTNDAPIGTTICLRVCTKCTW